MSNIKNDQTAKIGLSGLFGQKVQENTEKQLSRVEHGQLSREEVLDSLSEEGRDELREEIKRRQFLKAGRPRKGAEQSKTNTVPMTFRVNPEKQNRLRDIALKEKLFIGEILEKAIDLILEKYEKEGQI